MNKEITVDTDEIMEFVKNDFRLKHIPITEEILEELADTVFDFLLHKEVIEEVTGEEE